MPCQGQLVQSHSYSIANAGSAMRLEQSVDLGHASRVTQRWPEHPSGSHLQERSSYSQVPADGSPVKVLPKQNAQENLIDTDARCKIHAISKNTFLSQGSSMASLEDASHMCHATLRQQNLRGSDAHAQETLQRLERSQTRMGSPRRASRMALQDGSPSPKRRPRRLDVENAESSPETRATTPTRQALGDVTPGHNMQVSQTCPPATCSHPRATFSYPAALLCLIALMQARWALTAVEIHERMAPPAPDLGLH